MTLHGRRSKRGREAPILRGDVHAWVLLVLSSREITRMLQPGLC